MMREDMMLLLKNTLRTVAFRRGLAAAIVAASLIAGGTAGASEPSYLRVPSRALGTTQTIALEVNKSILVDLPTNVGEVIASQPAVATVVMRSKTRAIVQGVTGGDTNVFFLDPAGNNIAVLDIKVYQPRSDVGNALEAAIARTIPGSRIKVESVILDGTNRVVLSGTALSGNDVDRAVAMAVQFAGDEKNVASVVDVAGNQQVKLKVTVAEVGRDAVKQLGINLDGSITVNALTLGLQNTPAQGGASGVVSNNGFSADINAGPFTLNASLQALERRGAMRTLAEPTLTAVSGQEASFLAGGEFPVPTQIGNDGQVTYTFKEFGVNLKFTPTVKSNGMIGLAVDTSVSDLTTQGGISAGGITIPATKKRQATTTVELPAGQTLAIAGMLQDDIRQQVSALPGLGNIPILGALFRSRDFIHSQTELVVLVTPYMAQINGPDTVKPTSAMKVAGDAEAIFLGHMEKMYGVGSDGMRGGYSGSVGFVLD